MLQIIKNRPNALILSICAVVLSVVFLLGIVTAAPGKRTAGASHASQPNEAKKDQTVAATPPSGLPLEQFIDYRVIFPQDFL